MIWTSKFNITILYISGYQLNIGPMFSWDGVCIIFYFTFYIYFDHLFCPLLSFSSDDDNVDNVSRTAVVDEVIRGQEKQELESGDVPSPLPKFHQLVP